jgi:hypothetical protein
MDRTLLVPDEHMLDLLLLEERVIDRQHRTAGIAEEMLDALILKGANDHFGASHHLAHNGLLRDLSFRVQLEKRQ